MTRVIATAGLAPALFAGPALAQSGPQMQQIRSACNSDIATLCGDAKSNDDSVSACLRERVGQVSAACKEAVQSVSDQSKGHD